MILNYEAWADAIRQIETGDKPWGEPGDGGQSLGPYQFHPGAFWDWCEKPTQQMVWADWFRAAALNFATHWFRAYPEGTAGECAVVYHQHAYIRRASPEDFTADDYLQRFSAAYAKAGGSTASEPD